MRIYIPRSWAACVKASGMVFTQSFKNILFLWLPNWGVLYLSCLWKFYIWKHIYTTWGFLHTRPLIFPKLIIHDLRRRAVKITSRIPSTRIVGEQNAAQIGGGFPRPALSGTTECFLTHDQTRNDWVFSQPPQQKNGGRWCSHPKMGAVFPEDDIRFFCPLIGWFSGSIVSNRGLTQPNLHAKAVIVCSFSLWFLNRLLKLF